MVTAGVHPAAGPLACSRQRDVVRRLPGLVPWRGLLCRRCLIRPHPPLDLGQGREPCEIHWSCRSFRFFRPCSCLKPGRWTRSPQSHGPASHAWSSSFHQWRRSSRSPSIARQSHHGSTSPLAGALSAPVRVGVRCLVLARLFRRPIAVRFQHCPEQNAGRTSSPLRVAPGSTPGPRRSRVTPGSWRTVSSAAVFPERGRHGFQDHGVLYAP